MASSNKWLSKAKTFLLITGPSKGLGKVLAIKLASHLGDGSLILMLARDQKALEDTKAEILSVAPNVQVQIMPIDLGSKPHEVRYTDIINVTLEENEQIASNFQQAVIIHNAASIGRFANTEDLGDVDEWVKYLSLNVISPIVLNASFLKVFTNAAVAKRLVINISSGVFQRPIPSAAFYNTGKSARENFFNTLAAEDVSVKVLNYAPGPLETDMFRDAFQNVTHPVGKQMFDEIISSGRVLTCEQTTAILLGILEKDEFKSGAHIDYFDE